METKYIQSFIAVNAARINDKHNEQYDLKQDIKHLTRALQNAKPLYVKFVKEARTAAYSKLTNVTRDIAKAVEMQKALQKELREKLEAEKPVQAKPKFTPVFYTNGDGWIGGTFCVEVTGPDSYICHSKDGTSSTYEGVSGFAKLYAGVESFKAHTTRQYPEDVQAPGVYFVRDGNPKKDGVYDVMYPWHKVSTEQRMFKDGAWTLVDGTRTLFGNKDYDIEEDRYIIK